MFRWRHFVVAVGLAPSLIVYIGIVMQAAEFVVNINFLIDFLFYTVAGFAWIPLAIKVINWLAKYESK